MAPNPHQGLGSSVLGLGFGGAGFAGGLVVAGGVEDQFAEEFAGGGVDDADVQVVGEQQDVGSGVGSADADVVEAAAVAEVPTTRRAHRTAGSSASWQFWPQPGSTATP